MIFNSLGSNYNWQFIFRAFLSQNNPKYSKCLKDYLENKYQGEAILVYKGREALYLALTLSGLPKNSRVAINGLTCFAVFNAVDNAGFETLYLDTQALNFSPLILERKIRENPEIKIVIVQNTLGFPCEIGKIEKICKDKKIILIEDLAHSVGSFYADGREAGTIGDFVIFSFSQDKMVDGISGGALVIRNKHYQNKNIPSLSEIKKRQQLIDRFYPFFTYLIRKTYKIGFGKLLHWSLKKLNLLAKPMGSDNSIILHRLPNWYCKLINQQFNNLAANLTHRKQIAAVYVKNIKSSPGLAKLWGQINHSSNLRFPLLSQNRESLIAYLEKVGIHVSDIWYDAVISPKKYLDLTNYDQSCPESEKISSEILNLPTHRNTSMQEAKFISERINQWLNIQ